MPPVVSSCRPLVTPFIHSLPQDFPRHKYYYQGSKMMKLTKKKLCVILFFVLTSISVIRFLKITVTTSYSSPSASGFAPILLHNCTSSSPPSCRKIPSRAKRPFSSASTTILTKKEFRFLSNIISHRAPCNLLVFGLEPQHLVLASRNARGANIFLENNPEKLRKIKTSSNSTRIYRVEYQTTAKEAYKLLKHVRQDPACAPHSGIPLEKSTCLLALKGLPREVYKRKWDVVVVDGPGGGAPDAPGRMAAIYTASMIARAGNVTDVIVHDVHRMIEKWFSWEFLCEENLVSSKGRLWNFRIEGYSNSTTFCPANTILTE